MSALFFIQAPAFAKETLEDYVATCKEKLEIDSIPRFDCRDVNFIPAGQPLPTDGSPNFSSSNDYVAHRRIDNSTDVIFACRWVDLTPPKGTTTLGAASGEMIIHNRRSGKTCFFDLKVDNPEKADFLPHVPTTNPLSPTDSRAAEFWETPDNARTCTDCHVAGPYIASPKIVKALGKFGLLNDGHDTFGTKYTAVGSTFANKFNPLIQEYKQPKTSRDSSCAEECHAVGGNSPFFRVSDFSGAIIIPSIHLIIDEVITAEHMPPDNPKSDYRWINRDDPGSSGDWERMVEVKNDFPEFYCSNPKSMEAHLVDSSVIYRTNFFANTIRTFNLEEGLYCYNEDQASGKTCGDYETRYKCDGVWTGWYNNDRPTGTGDNESRTSFPKLCSNPTAIQARMIVSMAPLPTPTYITADGPPDRLYQFDKNGLVCRNEDQSDGKCSNYVVRFQCP